MNKIRKLQKKDLQTVRDWRNSVEVNRYLFNRHEISEEEHLDWFESMRENPHRKFFVYEEDNSIKGFLQLDKINDESGIFEWGFYIGPEFQGKGLGLKFANEILNYVFEELNAQKIIGQVIDLNKASIKFHKKLGFTVEGQLRNQCVFETTYRDVLYFGLLQDEWLNHQSS